MLKPFLLFLRFRLAEAEIKEIEDIIHTQHSEGSSKSTENVLLFNIRSKVIIGATSPLWVTVGVASLIIALPALAIKTVRHNIGGRMQVDDYRKDREGYLTKNPRHF
jgi:hypothetical protein